MNWKLVLAIILLCFLGFMVFVNTFNFLRLSGFFEEQKDLPDYLVIAHDVYLEHESNEDYYNCWDYSNDLVKRLRAVGYIAWIQRGFSCDKYCEAQDLSNCCDSHAWIKLIDGNQLIELEATTGRIIWEK